MAEENHPHLSVGPSDHRVATTDRPYLQGPSDHVAQVFKKKEDKCSDGDLCLSMLLSVLILA